MQTWKWLYNPKSPYRWRFLLNVVCRTALLFAVFDLAFVLLDPLPALGHLSAYNIVFDGRDRLPYGENPAAAYNLSLFQLDAMFASHKLAGKTGDHEYRVVLIGDSSVWGILLRPDETLAGYVDAENYQTKSGEPVRVYNLGYPTMSLTKDLMLLDYAMRYQPDLIIWLFTLESFDQDRQLDSALVQNNASQVKKLIDEYDLNQSLNDARLVELSTWDQSLIGQRRALADLLRLQFYGAAWTITGIDQEYRADYTPRAVDLSPDQTWYGLKQENFTPEALAFDVLQAGIERAGKTPVVLVNEPMFMSEGQNSDIRYNAFFPRWTYDEYRSLLKENAERYHWQLFDLWDRIPDATCYTDSPVHLTPTCSERLGKIIGEVIIRMADTGFVKSE